MSKLLHTHNDRQVGTTVLMYDNKLIVRNPGGYGIKVKMSKQLRASLATVLWEGLGFWSCVKILLGGKP